MKKHTKLLTGLAFGIILWALILVFEHTLLFRAQELSLWIPTKIWFDGCMALPAGFLTYLAQFFNQFLFYPWLGALLLVLLWIAVYALTLRIFHVPARWATVGLIPAALLVACTMEVGYWIFQIKTPAYLFHATIGMLFTLLAVRAWQLLSKCGEEEGKKGVLNLIAQVLFVVVLIAGGYPLFGFYALLAAVVIALLVCLSKQKAATKICIALLVVLGIFLAPRLYYFAYTSVRKPMMYAAGLPRFDFVSQYIRFWIPYILLYLSPLALAFCFRKEKKESCQIPSSKQNMKKASLKQNKPLLFNGLIILCLAAVIAVFWYKDYNFHTELKVEEAMDRTDYKEVLRIVKNHNAHVEKAVPRYIKATKRATDAILELKDDLANGKITQEEYDNLEKPYQKQLDKIHHKTEPTRLIVLAKNLALLKLGRAGDEMFKYLDGGAKPATPLDIRMMQVGGKMLYYNYARCNFCYRWCLEDGVEYGWKAEYMKYMAKTSILQGDYEASRKFTNTLSKTLFHRKWAKKYEAFADDPKKIPTDKEFATILPFYCYEDQLDGDNSLVEIYMLNYFAHSFANTTTPLFDEMGLMCALTLKDIPTFWQNFFRYANSHKEGRMPTHYQEAALLFGNLEPGNVDISKMPFDKTVQMKFKAFMEYARKYAVSANIERNPEVKKIFYDNFGDTYFYFYFFIRDVKSY